MAWITREKIWFLKKYTFGQNNPVLYLGNLSEIADNQIGCQIDKKATTHPFLTKTKNQNTPIQGLNGWGDPGLITT